MTRLTLVTSVLNGMPYLAAALASLGERSDSAVEHLVIDAGSTDGTLELLRTRPDLRLIERPGLTLYGAWNLAIAEATGEFVGFLNADDLLGLGGVAAILAALIEEKETDILCGDAEAFADDGTGPPRYRYADTEITGPSLTAFVFGAPIINAKFFRRSVLCQAGGFDEHFAIAADRDFLLRLLLGGAALRWRHAATPIYRYRIHPGSLTLAATAATRIRIAQEHSRMSAALLDGIAVDPSARRALRAWAAREGMIATYCHAREARPLRCLGTLASLVMSDPFFALRLPMARAAIGTIRRAIRPS